MSKGIVCLFILLYFCFPPSTRAEQRKLEANIYQHQDSIKSLSGRALLDAYKDITKQERLNNPDTALHYFELAIPLLATFPDLTLESELYTNIAWVYITKGEYEKAQNHADTAFSVGERNNDYRMQHNAVTALGAVALYTGDTGTGLNYFKQALAFSKFSKFVEHEASSLHNIALIYTQLGDLDVALEYLNRSRDLHSKENKPIKVAASEAQIAEIYVLMGNLEKAIPYYENSIATYEKTDSTFYIAKTKAMLAQTLSGVGRFSEAQAAVQHSINLLKNTGEDVHLRDELIISARIYLAEGKHHEAIDEFSKAMKSAEEVKSNDEVRQAAHGLARAHWKINNHDKALTFAKLALREAKVSQNDIAREQIGGTLAKIYASRNDYINAYRHLSLSSELNESNRKKEISDKNEQTENRFQASKREQQIEVLTKDNALHILELKQKDYIRNLWVACFIIFMLSAGFFIYRQKQKRNMVNERASLMADLVDKKNQLLADVSHELRTPLSVLHLKVEALQYNLVKDVDASYNSLLNKINEINNMISDIYQLAQSDIGALTLNILPHRCLTTVTAWTEELAETVKNSGFSWQQNIEIADDLTLKFDGDRIKQVLSNLVHNSIAYTDKPGEIAISANILKSHLFIQVEDSSPGVEKENLERIFERLFRVETSRSRATGGSGLGLSICQSIVSAHRGTILAAPSRLGGLAISIEIPIIRG